MLTDSFEVADVINSGNHHGDDDLFTDPHDSGRSTDSVSWRSISYEGWTVMRDDQYSVLVMAFYDSKIFYSSMDSTDQTTEKEGIGLL